MLHLPITLTFIEAFDVKDHLCLKNGWTYTLTFIEAFDVKDHLCLKNCWTQFI